MLTNTKNNACAVSMEEFGIAVVIMTSIDEIETVLDQYTSQPDWIWCQGRGKQYMYESLKTKLQLLDAHFSKHPELVDLENKEWADFCNDCMLLYVLDAFLFDKPFALVHPDSYAQNYRHAAVDTTGGVLPRLIPGIPVMN